MPSLFIPKIRKHPIQKPKIETGNKLLGVSPSCILNILQFNGIHKGVIEVRRWQDGT
jgi:hypothetical protein